MYRVFQNKVQFDLCLLGTGDCLLLQEEEAFTVIKAKTDNQYVSSMTPVLI